MGWYLGKIAPETTWTKGFRTVAGPLMGFRGRQKKERKGKERKTWWSDTSNQQHQSHHLRHFKLRLSFWVSHPLFPPPLHHTFVNSWAESYFFMTWIRRHTVITKKFQNFSWFQFYVYKLYDYIYYYHCSIDNCVELNINNNNFCENSSHFILKWFLPNSFGELRFLEESYK